MMFPTFVGASSHGASGESTTKEQEKEVQEVQTEVEEDIDPVLDVLLLLCLVAVVGYVLYIRRRNSQRDKQNTDGGNVEGEKVDGNSLEALKAEAQMADQRRKRADDALDADSSNSNSNNSNNNDDGTIPLSIYFGSQTGTAEGFSKDLAELGQEFGFRCSVVDLEDFDKEVLRQESYAIFVVATYGEGDAPDNAIEFDSWIRSERSGAESDSEMPGAHTSGKGFLSNLNFTVFGLGNSQYENYNAMSKRIDKKLEEFGGKRVYRYGDGDDDGTLEEDFEEWKQDVFKTLRSHAFPDAPSLGEGGNSSSGSGSDVAMKSKPPHFHFKASRIPAPSDKRLRESQGRFDVRYSKPPSSSSHVKVDLASRYYFETVCVPITKVQELRQSPGADKLGSTVHVEFDISGTGLSYHTAENLLVCPENATEDVEEAAQLLGFENIDEWFLMQHDTTSTASSLSSSTNAQGPLFPTPCTIRTALTCYCALNAVPNAALLHKFSHFATDPEESARLHLLSTKEGKEERTKLISNPRRTVLEVLNMFPSLRPDLAHFLESVPRLQPRWYTIASSPAIFPNTIQLAVSVVREEQTEISSGRKRIFRGVCSNQLANAAHQSNPCAYVLVKPSTFKVPPSLNVPMILCGPGTGIAPMRALLQERQAKLGTGSDSASDSDSISDSGSGKRLGVSCGEAVMFFGCRRPDEDFIYHNELMEAYESGNLSELYTAFSRQGKSKVYVQNKIAEASAKIWSLLQNGGYFFVCGGSQMGKDVMSAMETLIQRHGNFSSQEAKKYMDKLHDEGRYVQELWS